MATSDATHRPDDASNPRDGEVIECFNYDDAIVRLFSTATIFWGLSTAIVGIAIGLLMLSPAWNIYLPEHSFGRLQPVLSTFAIYAFVANAIFTTVYYSTQRLCKTRMWSDALSRLHFWLWQLVTLAVIGVQTTLAIGVVQRSDVTDVPCWLNLAIGVIWLLMFGGNFFMTLRARRQRHMYVALWFYLATIIVFTVSHAIRSWIVPIDPQAGERWLAGAAEMLLKNEYQHNILSLMFVLPFAGLMYYFVPKAAQRPLYSYKLGVFHFWGLLIFGLLAAPYHLHFTPVPEWTTSLGMLFGLLFAIAGWAGVINGWKTLRSATATQTGDPVLKFFAVGIAFYAWSCLVGGLQATKTFSASTQFTEWTVAHQQANLWGWVGLMSVGMLYWLMPKLYQAPIWSSKLANCHFWTATLGVVLTVGSLAVGGLWQGRMWNQLDDTGNLVNPEFADTVLQIIPFWWLHLAGLGLILIGFVMLGINALMTWTGRPRAYESTSCQAARLSREYQDPPAPVSVLADAPVLELGKKLDVVSEMHWHRRWERLPGKFAFLICVVVAITLLFDGLPVGILAASKAPLANVAPYTPLELAGREIYIREGCSNCHTQTVRPLVAETKRYGDYSQWGEYVFDRPSLWGDRRIGPDLHREGGKQTSFWHWTHLSDPQSAAPGSIMPSYDFLLSEDLDLEGITPLVAQAIEQGATYSESELSDAQALAFGQAERIAAEIVIAGGPAATYDKRAVALIAYLQRLGTDLLKTAAPAASDSSTAPEADASEPDGDVSDEAAEDTTT